MKNIKKVASQLGLEEVTRKVKESTKIILAVKSAGRCEFFNCAKSLIADDIIQKDLVWGEFAHIYAFKDKGPRGDEKPTGYEKHINDVENLLLLCPDCHTKIDKKELCELFPASLLKKYKREHEKRIAQATNITKDRGVKVIRMVANIEDEKISLSGQEMHEALLSEKFFSVDKNPATIDFTGCSGSQKKSYWQEKSREISETLKIFYGDLKKDKNIAGVCVFAIGPMPLLAFLGSRLENKIKTELFQRHRGNEKWLWPKSSEPVQYKISRIKEGKDTNKVALLLSLSGKIHLATLSVSDDYSVYEITLADTEPNYLFLKSKNDLHSFEEIYTETISKIKNDHPDIKEIELFPAVPAPVAILCGKALNRKSDPSVNIYDKTRKKFYKALKIN